jgi:branched-chain amino acid transport system permease protein/urea transport system permease protein
MGLAMIFGLLGVINLAHGEFLMLGAYVAVFVNDTTHEVLLAIVLAPLAIGILGFGVEQTVIKRLYERPAETLLATWALSIMAQQAVTLITGGQYEAFPSPVQGTLHFLGVRYPTYRLLLIGLGLALVVALWLCFHHTRFGLRSLAVIQDRETADALGVNVQFTDTVIFCIGAAAAGLAGVLVAPLGTVSPTMGLNYLALSFFVVILGGIGRVLGVAAGAVVIGGGQALFSFYWNPVISQVAILVLAIVVVRLRPKGLLRLP